MEATVKSVWDGWKYFRTPDNIEMTFSFDDGETVDVFASVLDLIELHDHVVERTPCDVIIGTGDVVELQFHADRATLALNGQHGETIPHRELQKAFEELLATVFAELEATGSADDWNRELGRHDRVEELYDEFG